MRPTLLVFLGLLTASLAPAEELTLSVALSSARSNSLLLEKARLELEGTKKARSAAGAHPALTLTASLRKELEDFRTFRNPPIVGLSQPFDLFGNRAAARRVASKDVALAELAIEGLERRLDYEVSRRFRTLQYRQDLLLAARFSRGLAKDFLSISERRRQAGAAPELDVVRGKTELFRTQGTEREASRAALRASRELGEAMGDTLWQSFKVSARLPGIALETSSPALLALAEVHRIDLRSFDQLAGRIAAEAQQVRQRRKPVLSGTLAVKEEDNQTFEYGGIQVDFTPLWYGRLKRQIEARELRRRAVLVQKEDVQRRTQIRLTGLLREVEVLVERLELLETQQLPSTERQLKMVEQGYRRGGLDNLSVLSAQQGTVATIQEYLSVLHEYHQVILTLRMETGMAPLALKPRPTSGHIQRWLGTAGP